MEDETTPTVTLPKGVKGQLSDRVLANSSNMNAELLHTPGCVRLTIAVIVSVAQFDRVDPDRIPAICSVKKPIHDKSAPRISPILALSALSKTMHGAQQ